MKQAKIETKVRRSTILFHRFQSQSIVASNAIQERRAKRVRSERDRPPNREGTVTDLGDWWQNTDVKQDATVRGRRPRYPPPPSLSLPSVLRYQMAKSKPSSSSSSESPNVMPRLCEHEPKERGRERERVRSYPFLPPVMYQACPRKRSPSRRKALSGVGFGIMNEIPPGGGSALGWLTLRTTPPIFPEKEEEE